MTRLGTLQDAPMSPGALGHASGESHRQPVVGFVIIGALVLLLVLKVRRAMRGSKQQPGALGYTPSSVEAPVARPYAGGRREAEFDHLLEELQDRLMRREISETVYGELKESLVRRLESGAPLRPREREESRPRVEKIVERQVLVTRCRYCTNLTPVDLSACAKCGAGL